MSELIKITKRTKQVLRLKKENTGKSMIDLVEFAVLNMPFIPPKDLNSYKFRDGLK